MVKEREAKRPLEVLVKIKNKMVARLQPNKSQVLGLKPPLLPVGKMTLLDPVNPELVERSEGMLGVQVKGPKMEKTLSKVQAIQLLNPEKIEIDLLKEEAQLTMHPHPEVADQVVAEESSMGEAEATEALTPAVQVVAAVGKQVAEAAGTIGLLPTAATTMDLLIKTTSGRHPLAVVGMGALSQIQGVLETAVKPEAKALNMKKCQNGGGSGDLKLAVRVPAAILLIPTKRNASQIPRLALEERTLQPALQLLQFQQETPKLESLHQGVCHQDVAEVEAVLEVVSIEVEVVLECLLHTDLDLALLLMAGLQNLQLRGSNRHLRIHPLLKIQVVGRMVKRRKLLTRICLRVKV